MSKLFPYKCLLVDWGVGVSFIGGITKWDHRRTTGPVPGIYSAVAGSASSEVRWGHTEPAQSE